MKLILKSFVAILSFFGICIAVHSQSATRRSDWTASDSSPLVTAQITGDHVRFAALTVGSRIRLEILSPNGETLFDSSSQPGNLIEWPLVDNQGSHLPDGFYGCIVAVEELSGRLTYRRGLFRLSNNTAVFDSPVSSQLEASAIDQSDENVSILGADERYPFTFVGHDGSDARIESTAGGLIFHAGQFQAKESDPSPHMRLSPRGDLGIGVAEPQTKLDVAGVIRASDGFEFSDGTVLKMEGGLPVLVTDGPQALPGSKTGMMGIGSATAGTGKASGKTIRFLATGGGGPGKVLGREVGSNTWYGEAAGASITTGTNNSFFGQNAGNKTSGSANAWEASYNSFFGSSAGELNTTGFDNTFFGSSTGYFNTTGQQNTFVGSLVAENNTTGIPKLVRWQPLGK
jgi:hypothetical protein